MGLINFRLCDTVGLLIQQKNNCFSQHFPPKKDLSPLPNNHKALPPLACYITGEGQMGESGRSWTRGLHPPQLTPPSRSSRPPRRGESAGGLRFKEACRRYSFLHHSER